MDLNDAMSSTEIQYDSLDSKKKVDLFFDTNTITLTYF